MKNQRQEFINTLSTQIANTNKRNMQPRNKKWDTRNKYVPRGSMPIFPEREYNLQIFRRNIDIMQIKSRCHMEVSPYHCCQVSRRRPRSQDIKVPTQSNKWLMDQNTPNLRWPELPTGLHKCETRQMVELREIHLEDGDRQESLKVS